LASNPSESGCERLMPCSGFQIRGLNREQAARYVGVSPSKFDGLVSDGRMPKPKRIDGRVIWDRMALDGAFEDLDSKKEVNPWDAIL
jgi:predicted DNA-binding transcriptional regulator AlpA